ncbi:MAG: SRPBCC family protein [Acidobacteriota bacterium]|nr:SRPBCC family protein [Acidobacteriota bacterium]
MLTMRRTTWIAAPVERVFRLAACLDLQLLAGERRGLRILAGRGQGLLAGGDRITWRQRVLGLPIRYQTEVNVWHPHHHFRTMMLLGPLRSYHHDRYFAAQNDGTRLQDEVTLRPGGVTAWLPTAVLRSQLQKRLLERNARLKQVAESNDWHTYLDHAPEIAAEVYLAQDAGERFLAG